MIGAGGIAKQNGMIPVFSLPQETRRTFRRKTPGLITNLFPIQGNPNRNIPKFVNNAG
jgi:hypothetical protein